MAAPAPAAVVPSSATDLFELLHKTGLFKPDVLNDKLGECEFPPDAAGAAAVLVRAGLLTQFQTRLLLAGKYRGFKLGTYHIRDQVGRGGMGTVYLAEHATLRRKVALKVLTADGAGQKAGVERFLREARAAAALDHPNIVRVFDVHQSGELHYIVMEYVEGRTLDSLVQGGGAMAPGRAVAYLSQAAAGLQHAYEKGFVHRDIKPANLMVAKDGTVKILDMGLARSTVDSGDRVTELLDDGAVVGTADFISPEQATNQPGVDIRADIYSLGATLFALIAGQPPFQGSTSQVLMQHQLKAAPSLADFDRTIAPGLAAVVAKMLAKKPAERFATPADVIAALAPWLPNRDGAQKVMAGLSTSELGRNSGTLQNTLDQVLSGSTRNLPRPDLAGKFKFGWVVAAAGVAAAVLGGVALYIVKGGLEPAPGTRKDGGVVAAATPATEPAKPPRPAATRPVAVKPAPRPAARSLYALDLSAQQPFTDRGRTGSDWAWQTAQKTGAGRLPAGWRCFHWSQEAEGEYFADADAGAMALGMRTLKGAGSAMLLTPPVKLAGPVPVTVDYRTDPGNTAVSNVRFIQTAPTLEKAVDVTDLLPTGGEWKTATFTLDPGAAAEGTLEFHNHAVGADQAVRLRGLTVGEAAVPATAEYAPLALSAVATVSSDVTKTEPDKWGERVVNGVPFRFDKPKLGGKNVIELFSPNIPESLLPKAVTLPVGTPVAALHVLGGVAVWGWPYDGDFAGGMSSPEGSPTVVVRLRYADGQVEEHRWLNGVHIADFVRRVDVPQSEFAFTFKNDSQARYLVIRPSRPQEVLKEVEFAKGEGDNLLPRIFAVTTERPGAAPPAAAGKPVLFRFDAGTVPEFRAGLLKNKAREAVPAELTSFSIGCFKEDATGELVRTTLDGAPALGIASRSGTPSAQLVWELNPDEFDPAREYALRVTYQSRGNVGGAVLVQNVSQNYAELAAVPLTPAGGGWQTTEVKFKRPAGANVKLAFQSTQQGPADGMAYIRTVELVDPTAAKPLFQLDPASVGSFRQRMQDRRTVDGAGASFPTGTGPYPWRNETLAEFVGGPAGGRPAVALTNLEGPESAQFMLNMEQRDNGMGLVLAPGKSYELRLDYRTVGGAGAKVYTQTTEFKGAGADLMLPGTNGEWRAAVYPFVRGSEPLRALIDLQGTGPGKTLYLGAITIVEAAAPGTPVATVAPPSKPVAAPPPPPVGAKVFALDLSGLPAFRGRFADGRAGDGVPTGIPGLGWYCWKKESAAEFRGEPTDAGPALGMTNLNDDSSAQFNLPLDEAPGDVSLKAGQRYVLRVQYRTTNDAAGNIQVRTLDYQTVGRADLPATGGGWRWADLPFGRGDGQKLHAILENGSVGEGNTLWLRAAEVHEAR